MAKPVYFLDQYNALSAADAAAGVGLLLPGAGQLDHDGSRADDGNGPFAEHFVVDLSPERPHG